MTVRISVVTLVTGWSWREWPWLTLLECSVGWAAWWWCRTWSLHGREWLHLPAWSQCYLAAWMSAETQGSFNLTAIFILLQPTSSRILSCRPAYSLRIKSNSHPIKYIFRVNKKLELCFLPTAKNTRKWSGDLMRSIISKVQFIHQISLIEHSYQSCFLENSSPVSAELVPGQGPTRYRHSPRGRVCQTE